MVIIDIVHVLKKTKGNAFFLLPSLPLLNFPTVLTITMCNGAMHPATSKCGLNHEACIGSADNLLNDFRLCTYGYPGPENAAVVAEE